jgi:hypothetical protein
MVAQVDPLVKFFKDIKSPFSKRGKKSLSAKTFGKALLPLRKGGREGFIGRSFQELNCSKNSAFFEHKISFYHRKDSRGCQERDRFYKRKRGGEKGKNSMTFQTGEGFVNLP